MCLFMSNETGLCPRWHSSSPAQASFTFLPFAYIYIYLSFSFSLGGSAEGNWIIL